MPASTQEMCRPVGMTKEQAAVPPNANCKISNMQRSGKSSSFDMQCTGKDAMSGRVEVEQVDDDTQRISVTASMDGESMKMNTEQTRLGKACQAMDAGDMQAMVDKGVQQSRDAFISVCNGSLDEIKKNGLTVAAGEALLSFSAKISDKETFSCRSVPRFSEFCAAAQTPAAFSRLDAQQWNQRSAPRDPDRSAFWHQPLNEAMKECKLGTGAAAIVKFQNQMLAKAQQANNWGFLLRYGANYPGSSGRNAQYDSVRAVALRECSGRSFTTARQPQYASLCQNYGVALAQDDRRGALWVAGCRTREDVAAGICVGISDAPKSYAGAPAYSGADDSASAMDGGSSGAGDDAGDAVSASNSGSRSGGGNAPPDQNTPQPDKPEDALKRGVKALRGLINR
jgi:hypothetical protein